MKTFPALTVVASLAFSLTACGDASTEADLPQGDTVSNTVTPSTTAGEDGSAPKQGEPYDQSDEDQLPGIDAVADAVADAVEAERTKLPGISFEMPKGWSKGDPKAMRLFTLVPPEKYKGADLAVNKWPGDVGGFAANVTRWARQAGVQPKSLKRADYPQIDVGGTQSAWIDFSGEGATNGILAVWVPIGNDPDKPTATWTFKMTGTPDQIKALAETVKAWAATVKFE